MTQLKWNCATNTLSHSQGWTGAELVSLVVVQQDLYLPLLLLSLPTCRIHQATLLHNLTTYVLHNVKKSDWKLMILLYVFVVELMIWTIAVIMCCHCWLTKLTHVRVSGGVILLVLLKQYLTPLTSINAARWTCRPPMVGPSVTPHWSFISCYFMLDMQHLLHPSRSQKRDPSSVAFAEVYPICLFFTVKGCFF